MAKYVVTISETVDYVYVVEALSSEEAWYKAHDMQGMDVEPDYMYPSGEGTNVEEMK